MLGVILAPKGEIPGGWPSEIAQARGGQGNYLTPDDPYYNQRGEVGWYHDTQLGAIPTDAELATNYGYTPVGSGWINAKEGYITGPWRFGWDPAGAYGPPTSLSGPGGFGGFGQTDPSAAAATALTLLQAQQSRAFKLMIISTSAIALSALLAAWRTSRELRKDAAKIHRDTAKIHRTEENLTKLKGAPIPTYQTSADVLARKNGAGWRLAGWTLARTLLIAPPMLVVGVPNKQAWLGAGLASGLISMLALLRIFDASRTGLAGSKRSYKRYARR